MLFVKLKEDAAHHPKIEELALILGVPFAQAFGYVTLFWLWCLKYAPDGDLSGHNARKIAIGAKFQGDPEAFVQAMCEAGLVDRAGEGLGVHDWADHMSAIVRGVARNSAKCAAYRERQKLKKKAASQDRPGVATKTTPSQTKTETETFSVSNDTHSANAFAPSVTEEVSVTIPEPGQVIDQPEPEVIEQPEPEVIAQPKPKAAKKPKAPKAEQPDAPTFEDFWTLYPRKKDKQRCERTWAKLMPLTKVAALAGLKAQLPGMLREVASGRVQYIKHPTTWLNAGAWEDQPDDAVLTTTDLATHAAQGDPGYLDWVSNYAEQRKKMTPGGFVEYVVDLQTTKGVKLDDRELAEAWDAYDTDGERVEACLKAIYRAKTAQAVK